MQSAGLTPTAREVVLAGVPPFRRGRRRSGARPPPVTRIRAPPGRGQAIDVSYGPVQVLFGIDFKVEQGEIVALLGTNGAGKSTLLRALSGLLNPSGAR